MRSNYIFAQTYHAEELMALINQAYRPEDASKSWTNETNLVAGQRISCPQILDILASDSVLLLLLEAHPQESSSKILACVQIQPFEQYAYIGMLTTHLDHQNQGLAKHMLKIAESYIIENYQVSMIKMSVLSKRKELIAFYQRRGYTLSEEVADYPSDAGVGQPLSSDLKVFTLNKHLIL